MGKILREVAYARIRDSLIQRLLTGLSVSTIARAVRSVRAENSISSKDQYFFSLAYPVFRIKKFHCF